MNWCPGQFDERTVVRARLQQLDGVALAAFVADLWDATGFRTTRDGTTIRAETGERTLRIGVGAGAAAERPNIVVDVDGGGPSDIETVDAADLAERLWYGIDRPVARSLCRRHLGGTPAELSMPLSACLRAWTPVAVRQHSLAVGLVTLVVLALVGGAYGIAIVGPSSSDGGRAAGTPTPQTAVEETGTTDDASAIPESALPPGVSRSGITDLDRLAAAHEDRLANWSYTVSIDYYRPPPGTPAITRFRAETRILTNSSGQYLMYRRQVVGNRTERETVYHDGNRTFVASGPNNEQVRTISAATRREQFGRAPSNLTARLVKTRLSTETTELTGTVSRGGTTLYRIVGRGNPSWPDIRSVDNYSVVAFVTGDGFVRSVRAEYTVGAGFTKLRVRRSIRYLAVDATTVDPPAWYETTIAAKP